MEEFVIVFRESLEAAIIVGIVLTLLNKVKNKRLIKVVGYAVASAVLLSLLCAWALQYIEQSIGNEAYSKLFEAGMMYLAAGFLLYMVLWLSRKKNFTSDIKDKTNQLSESGSALGIYFLVLFAILREGFETALFLYGANSATDFSYFGFFSGIILACGIAYLMFFTGKRVNLKSFFKYSSLLLIAFSAGMMAYGTHEFEEYLEKSHIIEEEFPRAYEIFTPSTTLAPSQNATFYSFDGNVYQHLLHDGGKIGQYFKGFFGYNSNPNWAEVIIWLLTFGFGLAIYYRKS